MWSELYINDPDILSDVTEIAVKKLGYWIERRLREGRSSPVARFYLHTHTHARTHTHTYLCVYIHTHIFIYICIYVYMYADRSLLKVVLKRALVSRIFWFSDSVFVCRSSKTRARISREATSPLKYSNERLTFPMTFVVNYRRRLPTFLYRISCTILVRVSPLQPRLLFSPITR